MNTAKDHYSPLYPTDLGTTPIDAEDRVCLGPFCDEEHARETLGPLFAPYNVRVGSRDDAQLGPLLFEAQALITSEGVWVEVEAGLAGHCSAEFTDYGFQVLPTYARNAKRARAPLSFRVHPLASVDGTLHRKPAIAEHPNDGPGDPTDGPMTELLARGNTISCQTARWRVELRDAFGDNTQNLALHSMLCAKQHTFTGAPGAWTLELDAAEYGPFDDATRDELITAHATVRAAHPPAWAV